MLSASKDGAPERIPEALFRHNGFCLFKQAVDGATLTKLRREVIQPALGDKSKFTSTDATSKVPVTAQYVFDSRFLDAVAACIGRGAKFLQCSDLQINHNAYGWHRDSASRQVGGVDWRLDKGPYTCVKAILYIDCERFGMEVVPRSHLVEIERAKLDRASQNPDFLSNDSEAPFFSTDGDICRPVVIEVKPGDILVFDLRLLHRGHPGLEVSEEERVALGEKAAKRFTRDKATLSFVYGLDNFQSQRYHAYFRYHRRDSAFREPTAEFSTQLSDADLLLSTWHENFLEKDGLARTDLFVSDSLKKIKKASPRPERRSLSSRAQRWLAQAKRYVAGILGA
jgi:hypothetical protein